MGVCGSLIDAFTVLCAIAVMSVVIIATIAVVVAVHPWVFLLLQDRYAEAIFNSKMLSAFVMILVRRQEIGVWMLESFPVTS